MLRTRMSVTVLVAVIGMILVPGAAAQVPTQDSVEGTVTCPFPTGCVQQPTGQHGGLLDLTADARSGPSGENPTGTMTWDERIAGGFSTATPRSLVSRLRTTWRSSA